MSACIIRRKSDGLYRSRVKNGWDNKRHWVADIKKARIFTNIGHAKVSLKDASGVVNINGSYALGSGISRQTSFRKTFTYTCENCCYDKWHLCKKHETIIKLLEKWCKKAVENNFYWTYEVIPVEFNIGK